MSDLELCYMPAHEALRRFRERSLSPVELMGAGIARAEAVEPTINAFTYSYLEEALDRARVFAPSRACPSPSRTRAISRASRPRTAR